MHSDTESQRLQEGLSWLIGLRWVAMVWVCVGTVLAGRLLHIGVVDNAIYTIVGMLAIYNLLLWLVVWLLRRREWSSVDGAKRLIGIQMTIDLVLLTAIFHFSGGIENPFIFFYVFHVLIAGILLSVRDSWIQATVGVILFSTLVSLECFGVIPHHCLTGFLSASLHQDRLFVFGTLFGFITAMYLVAYLGGFVAGRLRDAEAAQSRANAALREKDRIKDEYVYRVSHDIKGNLAAVQSCLTVVTETPNIAQDQRDSFVDRALKRTRHLTQFVKDLLRLTQMRLNNQLIRERLSFPHTLRSALEQAESHAQARSITLDATIPDSLGFIHASVLVVEEVVTNLLFNAIKYTSEGGSVTLAAQGTDKEVRVEIADTGVGIPKDEVEHVFDEFYRASNVREVERDGNGMGLTLVKHIIERYGGHIGIESELGVGTRVHFTLPRGAAPKVTLQP